MGGLVVVEKQAAGRSWKGMDGWCGAVRLLRSGRMPKFLKSLDGSMLLGRKRRGLAC
jgi:hypothetical protein